MTSLDIAPIPAFADNYLWLLSRGARAVVVDPGDAAPVQAALAERGLQLEAILITHHHPDHIGGLAELLAARQVPVYGPRKEASSIRHLTDLLQDGDQVEVLGRRFEVIEVPGHTLGHIAYYSAATDGAATELHGPLLLCGDTLFSGGCGRLFEGTPEQMHASLGRLAALPGATQVYCTHEYTRSNLQFARVVEPGNAALAEYWDRVRALLADGLPTVPSSIEHELRINPFLRIDQPAVRQAVQDHSGQPIEAPAEVFAALRRWKDEFRPPAEP